MKIFRVYFKDGCQENFKVVAARNMETAVEDFRRKENGRYAWRHREPIRVEFVMDVHIFYRKSI